MVAALMAAAPKARLKATKPAVVEEGLRLVAFLQWQRQHSLRGNSVGQEACVEAVASSEHP